MAATRVLIGDSVRYVSTFRDTNGDIADPDSNAATFTAYNEETLQVVVTGAATRLTAGVYKYEFLVPGSGYEDEKNYILEIKGNFGSVVQLQRDKVKARFKPA